MVSSLRKASAFACVAGAAAALLGSSEVALADPPACSATLVKEGIIEDARAFVDQAHKIPNFPDEGETGEVNKQTRALLFPSSSYDVNLSEIYETAHTDAIRSCSGKLTLRSADRTEGTTGIAYEAIKTEDGETLHRLTEGPNAFRRLVDTYISANNIGLQISSNIAAYFRGIAHSMALESAKGMREYSKNHPEMNTPFADSSTGSHFGQGGPVPGMQRAPQ